MSNLSPTEGLLNLGSSTHFPEMRQALQGLEFLTRIGIELVTIHP
jgi:hypothetical protein